MFAPYHVIKGTNGDELFKNLNKPLSLKYNGVAMSDNHAEVMIEIQHSASFILFFNETHFLHNRLKLFEV